MPCDAVDDTYTRPAGSRSSTDTFVAPFGPAFVTVTVYVTFVPRFGVALLTVLASCRSADGCALSEAEPALLPVFGSNWSPALFVAVLVIEPGVSTVAVMSSVAFAPFTSAPTVHRPVLLSYVPCDGVDDTYSRPLGNASRTAR